MPDEIDLVRKRGVTKKTLEQQLSEYDDVADGTILKWITAVLDGKEVSDYAQSFPIVRRVMDLKADYAWLLRRRMR